MLGKRLFALIVLGLAITIYCFHLAAVSLAQNSSASFKDNSCVECHAGLSSPANLSLRYLDWHFSAHKIAGVSCDKCHGGNPGVKDKGKAHAGILPSGSESSKLNAKNLPETCGACHQQIVSAFVQSKHYRVLKSSGLGPSCNTCHAHMASQLIYTPEEAAQLCTTCHDSSKALMPRRPDIPQKANEVMIALQRANGVVLWANGLVIDGKNKKVDVSAEEKKLTEVRTMLADTKATWHTFNLDTVRQKADGTFNSGAQVKDTLLKRLYPQ
jgi:hypothetical protein